MGLVSGILLCRTGKCTHILVILVGENLSIFAACLLAANFYPEPKIFTHSPDWESRESHFDCDVVETAVIDGEL